MFAYLAAIASGHYAMIFLTAILVSGVVYSAQNGVWPALYRRDVPHQGRLSGTAIGTQIGSRSAASPPVAVAIAGDVPSGWVPVAAYVFAFSTLAAIAVATARETYDIPLQELDGRRERVMKPTVTRVPHAEPTRPRASLSERPLAIGQFDENVDLAGGGSTSTSSRGP